MKEIIVNGVVYIPKTEMARVDNLDYVIVRTESAGVHAGLLESKQGNEVVLRDARRIFYWEGAFTLSELALQGTSKPEGCQFPPSVPSIILLGVIEVIPCTDIARQSIVNVPNHEY